MCHYQHGDLSIAETKFLQAVRRASQAAEPVNALAWLYAVDLERPTQARAVINAFLESGGREDAALMDTHGTVLLRLGELDSAQQKLEQCLRYVGETSTKAAANYHLSLVLLESGYAEEALAYAQRSLRLAARLGGLTDKERSEAERLVAKSTSPVPESQNP
jgi:tetratricopeptide (TPR) repeat protein